jgi:hypothetical protein
MILGPRELQWQERVLREAREHGWTVFEQAHRNSRVYDPSVILVRVGRVLALWLRTSMPRQRPDTSRFGPGVEGHVWVPADWPRVVSTLLIDPTGRGHDHAA